MRRIISILILGCIVCLGKPVSAKMHSEIFVVTDFKQTQGAYKNLETIIKEIDEQQQLEYLFLDIGYAKGEKLNTYLTNGDEQLLEDIMTSSYPAIRTEEFKELIQEIYKLNQQKNVPIKVIGIGLDRREDAIKALETLLQPYIKIDESIKEDLEEIKSIPSKEVFYKFKRNVEMVDSIYREYLSDEDWVRIELLINSVLKDELGDVNTAYAYEIYKADTILIIEGMKELEIDLENPYIINFEYEHSQEIDWETMKTKEIVEGEAEGVTEEKVWVKNSLAAQPYKFNYNEAIQFIADEGRKIDITDESFVGIRGLDSLLEGHRLFLAGEVHGNIGTYEMQLYLIKYFHEKAGVNKILIEYNYAVGEMINKYIQTGDGEILKIIMEEMSNSYFYSKEFEKFLHELYLYNLKQEQGKEIQIIGVDIARNQRGVKYLWDEIFKGKEVERLESIQASSYAQVRDYYKAIEMDIKQYRNEYKEILGEEDLFRLEMLLIALTPDYMAYADDGPIREMAIVQMYEKIAQNYPKDKFFAQMGAFHASQSFSFKEGDGYSCGEYLSKFSPFFKDQVLTLIYTYKDSFTGIEGSSNLIKIENTSFLQTQEEEDYMFIDLHHQENPLSQLYLSWQEAPLQDVLQGIIEINRKGAVTPYKS